MNGKLSVVLCSGGLDSAVAAALTAQNGALALLHFDFGQRAAAPEARAFEALCRHFQPAHQLVATLGPWRQFSESPLVRPGKDIEDAAAVGQTVASTFAPMLHPTMLCAAAGWAQHLGASGVIWGMSLSNPGHYPDRNETVRLLAWQLAVRALPAERAPVIDAPLAQYDKSAVVELGRQLDVPLDKTWSCLRGGEQPCGVCLGCAARAKAMGVRAGD